MAMPCPPKPDAAMQPVPTDRPMRVQAQLMEAVKIWLHLQRDPLEGKRWPL